MHATQRTTVRAALLVTLVTLVTLAACGARRGVGKPGVEAAAAEGAVNALADTILAAARARDAERFAAHFEPGEGLVYVLNTTTRLSSQAALRDAFRGMLGRQRDFDPRWADRRTQVLAPGVAVFTGTFRTTARDSSGTSWAARGVVTFVARHGPAGWRVVNWHTSETTAAP